MEVKNTYIPKWIIIILIILFPMIGLFLLWFSSNFKNITKILITLFTVSMIILALYQSNAILKENDIEMNEQIIFEEEYEIPNQNVEIPNVNVDEIPNQKTP